VPSITTAVETSDSTAIRGGVFVPYSDCLDQLPGEDLAEAWVFAEFTLRLLLDEQAGIDFPDGYPVVDGMFDGRPQIHHVNRMISV
jgi:hypothetical protein